MIHGDAGSDVVRSGRGSDRIDVRDGEPDRVDCGRGWDRVIVDGVDDVSGCERVVRSGRR